MVSEAYADTNDMCHLQASQVLYKLPWEEQILS